MIQLIAADLDGTLLDSNKRLSPDLFPLIRTLGARGVRFAAASGRQVDNLRALFAPLAGEMLLIAENGAAVYDGPRCLFADQLPAAYFFGPIRTVRTLPGVGAVLCTHEGAFIEAADDPVFVQNARMYYEKLDVVPDLLTVLARIPAFKLAVFQKGRAESGCWPVLQAYAGRFAVVLSGADWVDLMNPATNKGTALHRLAGALHIPLTDTMPLAITSTTLSSCPRPAWPMPWRTGIPISNGLPTASPLPTTRTAWCAPSQHISAYKLCGTCPTCRFFCPQQYALPRPYDIIKEIHPEGANRNVCPPDRPMDLSCAQRRHTCGADRPAAGVRPGHADARPPARSHRC